MSAIFWNILAFLFAWGLNAMALFGVGALVPGVKVRSFRGATMGALVIGLVSWLVKPVLTFFSLPVIFLTFGAFYLVVMALCFALAGWLTRDFEIDGALPAFLGALCMTVFTGILGFFIPGIGWW